MATNDEDFNEPSEETHKALLERSERAQRLLTNCVENRRRVNEKVKLFIEGALPVDVHELAPLKLTEALCLPELGGTLPA